MSFDPPPPTPDEPCRWCGNTGRIWSEKLQAEAPCPGPKCIADQRGLDVKVESYRGTRYPDEHDG